MELEQKTTSSRVPVIREDLDRELFNELIKNQNFKIIKKGNFIIEEVRQEVRRVIAMLWGKSASSEVKQFDIDLWIKQAEKILDDDFSQNEKETYVDIEWKMAKTLE
nr:12896_t:CDS:2 [Entrophospora candida]